MRFTILLAVLISGTLVGSQAQAQKVFVFGHATQAFGQASDAPQNGLGLDATADMRAIALQGRLAFLSTGTQFVVQGAHRRVGGSPIATLIDYVELDWLFAEQRLGDFSARVGRIPIPKGLLNERRDVGTLLPFYQASKAFYTDGIETVDGATARYTRSFAGFDLEAQAFGGEIPVVIVNSGNAIDEKGDQTFGGQLTVGLPLQGARVLFGMLDSDVWIDSPLGPSTVELDWEFQWLSAEYQLEDFYARAEHSWSIVPTWQQSRAYYVQAGARVYDRLWLTGQREHESTRLLIEGPAQGYEYDAIKDWAIGASFKFTPNLVLKAEQHFAEGYALDQPVDVFGPAVSNRYFLISVAATF
ncbi:MAG: hypothetical protein V3T08_09000 [Gemmatimonadota bacterium]